MAAVSTDMGREINHGHLFIDHNWGWGPIENDSVQLDAWGAWVDVKQHRSVSFSLPMLPGSADGGVTTILEHGDLAGLAAGKYDQHFTLLGQTIAARNQFTYAIIRLG